MLLTANHVTHDIQAIADQSALEANRTAQEGPERVWEEWRAFKAQADALDRKKRIRRLGLWLGLAGLAVVLGIFG